MQKQLEAYLYEHIPLTQAIGIQVVKASSQHVILSAPFEPNINHKKTVFGGSLHAVATMACWSLLYLNLKEEPFQIVITESVVDYQAPVEGDFQAESHIPPPLEWQRFLKMLQKKIKPASNYPLKSIITIAWPSITGPPSLPSNNLY